MRSWAAYPDTYRAREVQIVLAWIRTGVGGAVVGGPGSGKSNLLGFLCHRPDVVQPGLEADTPVFLIPLDLNNLPNQDLSTLYRAILRGFYEARERLNGDLHEKITTLFGEHQSSSDPFVAQSALREWLLRLQREGGRCVLVVDRFDWFCEHAPAEMAATLRGLRDSFKDTLSYIVGTRREPVYFADREALGELYELLDTFTCWIRPLVEADARRLVAQETGARRITEEEVRHLLQLSGNYPSLLKAACHWWLSQETLPPREAWVEHLLRFPALAHRLELLWQALTMTEQQALQSLLSPGGSPSARGSQGQQQRAMARLEAQGLVRRAGGSREIRSRLLAAHAAAEAPTSPGGLWLDDETDIVYRGDSPLDDLSPLEGALLRALLRQPYTRHTHTELIEAAWPEDTLRAGVSTEALYQVVRGLRRKVEPRPSRPRYIVNWRGTPEGGYRCFPEGKPR